MLTSRHECLCILNELEKQGIDITEDIKLAVANKVPKSVVSVLRERKDPVVQFYLTLNNKAHKIIKEILTCDGKPINNYIKIATSIITQSAITLEHCFVDDMDGQNAFIKNMGLENLSRGLYEYFSTGDYTLLVNSVQANKEDVKLILD
jgi:hypothetical protein